MNKTKLLEKQKELTQKLDKYQKDDKLTSDEGLTSLEEMILITSALKYGVYEKLDIPKDLILDEDDYSLFIGDKNRKNYDVVFCTLHAGIEYPRKYKEYYQLKDWRKVIEDMLLDKDFGSICIANKLIEDIYKNKDLNVAVVFYKTNRSVADPNRLITKQQLHIDSTEDILKNNIDKEKLASELVDSFIKNLEDFIKKINTKLIIHFHTYEEYNHERFTQKYNGHIENKAKRVKRPTNMIFQRYKHENNAFGKFGKESDSSDFNFISDNMINKIHQILEKNISKIEEKGAEFSCPVDEPYKSPVMLPALLKKNTDTKNLVIEYRKDLFKKGYIQIYNSILEIINQNWEDID